MREISIHEINNIAIGQVEDPAGATGCTVLICKDGMPAGEDVRGGGPASRESELLKPTANASEIHAVVLAGGSAFGLNAGGGVMKYLEEHGIGLDVGVTKVPLVCQADLFDLTVADPFARPTEEMGYKAAEIALTAPNYQDGNYGAGCGATVGKFAGMDYCMKSGIGSYAVEIEGLQVGAIVAVNALGDIYDWKNGQKIAGLLGEDKKSFRDSLDLMCQSIEVHENKFVENTTIGVIITNAAFDKTKLCKIAAVAQNGYARSIRPVHTSADGDSIFAVSVGDVAADQDLVAELAANVMAEAIKCAIYSAESAYGYPAAKDL